MKRKIINGVLIVLFFVLQSTLSKYIRLSDVAPNLLVILIAATAYFYGKTAGMVTGFFSGLLVDLFFGDILGFYSLVYMLVGYLCGMVHKKVLDFDYRIPLLLIAAGDLAANLMIYWCLFMMRGRLHFGYYFRTLMVPEIVYTVLISVLVYRFLYWIYERLTLEERRRDGYFA